MKLFAYGSVPKDGGTFTLYKSLRQGLKPLGWDVCCVTVGAREYALWNDAFADEGCVPIAQEETNLKRQARAFVDWCVANGTSVVMPVNSRAMLSAVPHVSPEIRIVTRCADTTAHGYNVALYTVERLSRTIALTPRHVKDMIQQYQVPRDKIVLIPHGIDLKPFKESANSDRGENAALRLAYLGSLGRHKGVLLVPNILQRLDALRIAYHLDIAGSGIDRDVLAAKLERGLEEGKVSFLGTISRRQVPQFLWQADVLLFPSHNEGFGFVLIEAMAAGCVPVASKIRDVTDFIVDDGRTGTLCPVGDIEAFANAITALYEDRVKLQQMSQAAMEAVRKRFGLERVAADYAQMLDSIMVEAPIAPPPLPWNKFRVPPPYRSRLRDVIPRPVKTFVHRLLCELKLSDKYV